jgi:predicted ribosomally synthesized peptide with SipW-like signal peptide
MKLSRRIKVVLALGTMSSAVWASTYATFTDSATATSTFTAGSVDLVLNADTSDAYSFTTLSSSNMKPTDVVYAPLTVANTGTLGFSFSMASSSTNADSKALRDTLEMGIKLVANAGACDAAGYAASATTIHAQAAINGQSVGARTLSAGSSEVWCFKVELPSGAGDSLQGATTTTTMTFSATQS